MNSNNPDHLRVVELFSGTPWEAELIHSMLTDAGIQSFVRNTAVTSYLYDPIQASGVKVMILETDMIEAQAVINTARTATDHD